VPLLLGLAEPRSVVDVGCGLGTWLSVFRNRGIEDVHGVDGTWVDPALLEIPRAAFTPADLERPLALGRSFDLAISLEVAEHLPAAAADTFVDSLTALAPVVAFSASIPMQGGTNHVNEQWPDYWAERFEARGYVTIDAVRPRIWGNPRVDWYYAQNLLVFARPAALAVLPVLRREVAGTVRSRLALVHPRGYLEAVGWRQRLLKAAEDLAASLPHGARVILVDQGLTGGVLAGLRPGVPFLERDGRYWGPPEDDATAICELERLRARHDFVVFAWPAFWWLDHYADFHRHLRATARCVLDNERAVVFDLRSGVAGDTRRAG
jgi:SAM-dependent methyltransferase